MRKIVLAALLAAFPLSALAQTSPGLVFGQVPTAGQWNSYFAAKQDVLGYTPVNKAGDVMLGPLVTAPPTASLSGFNLPHGTSPTTPANGDMWTTTSGLFVRINGATVGPIDATPSTTFTPSLSCGTATFTVTSAKFKKLQSKFTWISIDYTITAIGTCTTPISFNLPNTTAQTSVISGKEFAVNGIVSACITVGAAATTACTKNALAVFLVNERYIVSGTYENQ